MKTKQYKTVRFFCGVLIILTVILNLVYLGFCIWNYKIFDIERTLLYGKYLTVRSCSLSLIYLNIFLSFIFGYAFNIASKYLLKVSVWMSLMVNGFGVLSCLYTHTFASIRLEKTLQTRFFSLEGYNISIVERYPGEDFSEIMKKISNEFNVLKSWFIMFEICNIISIFSMMACGVLSRFLKINKEVEIIPNVLEETVGEEIKSLRPEITMISALA